MFQPNSFIIKSVRKYQTILGVFVVLAIMVVALASSDVSAIEQSASERNIQGWISQLNQDSTAPSVREAQSSLERSGEAAVDGLVLSLSSSNPTVRRNAAEVLGYIGSPRAVDPLIQSLTYDSDPKVRTESAWALSGLNSSNVLNPLERASLLDTDASVRLASRQAVEALRWSMAQNAQRDVKAARALVVPSSQPSMVYLGVDDEFLSSGDGGRTWASRSRLPDRILSLATSPSDSSVVFAGTESQALLKSTDGGLSWSQVGGNLGEGDWIRVAVTSIAINPDNADHIFVAKGTSDSAQGSFSPLGVSVSKDGGISWSAVDLASVPDSITRLMVAGSTLYGMAGDIVFSSASPVR